METDSHESNTIHLMALAWDVWDSFLYESALRRSNME